MPRFKNGKGWPLKTCQQLLPKATGLWKGRGRCARMPRLLLHGPGLSPLQPSCHADRRQALFHSSASGSSSSFQAWRPHFSACPCVPSQAHPSHQPPLPSATWPSYPPHHTTPCSRRSFSPRHRPAFLWDSIRAILAAGNRNSTQTSTKTKREGNVLAHRPRLELFKWPSSEGEHASSLIALAERPRASLTVPAALARPELALVRVIGQLWEEQCLAQIRDPMNI